MWFRYRTPIETEDEDYREKYADFKRVQYSVSPPAGAQYKGGYNLPTHGGGAY